MVTIHVQTVKIHTKIPRRAIGLGVHNQTGDYHKRATFSQIGRVHNLMYFSGPRLRFTVCIINFQESLAFPNPSSLLLLGNIYYLFFFHFKHVSQLNITIFPLLQNKKIDYSLTKLLKHRRAAYMNQNVAFIKDQNQACLRL